MIERMTALRGATTVDENSAEQIISRTSELIAKLKESNSLFGDKNIVYCLIGSTADITAYSPARAVRESGLLDCPLFSSLEPPIDGSLPLCIRVLLTVADCSTDEQAPKHQYLHGAKTLRPDLAENAEECETAAAQDESTPESEQKTESSSFCIAIDGPSGAGKSTAAKLLAKRLNMTYLDTGAMYRAIGLKMYGSGVSLADTEGIEKALASTEIAVEIQNGIQHVYLDGKDVSGEIRRHYVSKLASDFSAVREVRLKLVEMQRKIAAGKDCILDGRDIGTYVLPDAKVKFYLTASVDVRARRRYDELTAKGETADFDNIRADIEQRDYNDMHREFAPLRKADDAVEVVTDDMNIDQVIAYMTRIIEEKRGK